MKPQSIAMHAITYVAVFQFGCALKLRFPIHASRRTRCVQLPPSGAICLYFSTRRTTPGRGSVPKWFEPGEPKVSATLENLTSVPPVTTITKGDGETGAGLPFNVIVAVPDTWNPPVTG